MAPTPPWMIFTTTSSLVSFRRLCFIASTEPCTSAFTTIPNSFKLPSWIWLNRSSSISFALLCEINVSAKLLASLSFSQATNTSPAFGTSFRPRISTGIDGPASFTRLPLSSIIALTLPCAEPAATESPTRRIPFCTRTVATEPLPLSSCASSTSPLARRLEFAFSSRTSAVRTIISINSSSPCPVLADTGTNTVLPPQSSGISSYSVNSCFTRSIFALGLSILFTATTISTPAALAWLIASTV